MENSEIYSTWLHYKFPGRSADTGGDVSPARSEIVPGGRRNDQTDRPEGGFSHNVEWKKSFHLEFGGCIDLYKNIL